MSARLLSSDPLVNTLVRDLPRHRPRMSGMRQARDVRDFPTLAYVTLCDRENFFYYPCDYARASGAWLVRSH